MPLVFMTAMFWFSSGTSRSWPSSPRVVSGTQNGLSSDRSCRHAVIVGDRPPPKIAIASSISMS